MEGRKLSLTSLVSNPKSFVLFMLMTSKSSLLDLRVAVPDSIILSRIKKKEEREKHTHTHKRA